MLHRIEVVGDGTGLVAAGEAMHAQLGVDWTSDAMFVMKGQRSYKKCSEDHWLPNRSVRDLGAYPAGGPPGGVWLH